MTGQLPDGLIRSWGTPVRLKGGHLTHWAGRDRDGSRLLAHGDYAWTDNMREPLPGAPECPRCKRRQPAFITAGGTP